MDHADDQLAALVRVLVHTAQTLLKNQKGEFYPFAAFINASGKPEMLGADLGVERPPPKEVIGTLSSLLRQLAGEGKIIASGICVNVVARLPGHGEKVDAICCAIEQNSQPPMDLYVPYHKGLLGRFKYERPVALPGASFVFAPAQPQVKSIAGET